MTYGTESTTYKAGNSEITKITKKGTHLGKETVTILKQYKTRVKINSYQDELAEYLKFRDELQVLRDNGSLTAFKEDSSTRPSFILDFPKQNSDDSYFVIKNWTIAV